jgi:hypothetical protein
MVAEQLAMGDEWKTGTEAYYVWGLSRMKSTEGQLIETQNVEHRTQNAERRPKEQMFQKGSAKWGGMRCGIVEIHGTGSG